MEYKDYYKILGVDKGSSQSDIKSAYRKLAKKYHPDANPDNKKAEEKFKSINEAYEVLGDEEKRKKYDQFGSGYNFQNGMNFDPSQFGFGGFGHSGGGANGDFSDFFNMVFGNDGFDLGSMFGRGGTRRGPAKGQDIEAEISVSIKEAYEGAKKTINLKTQQGNKSLSIKIPKGILPGKKIKLKGQGHGGMGGPNGDLYLKINFEKNSSLELDGLNIYTRVDLTPWEAALGCETIVETLDGKIKVKIPPSIQPDGKIKIPKKGYKDRTGNAGDLYIKTRIVNPKNLTEEEKNLYEKLKDISKFNPRS
ncbi:DnaJ C-terminal domain-containing protein [Anaeromicrobium sediminis]|uniref:Heat-shock protein n=1 Tax=Anaeromicrobium sediminis TaxID=1478221 RepID=A0A267MKD8_9FIRM|nr:J domain-containing protein [Anaeromicrobium sediminis]PAB59250.1 heat-shock protein [Anaeromicrobium sediminis]